MNRSDIIKRLSELHPKINPATHKILVHSLFKHLGNAISSGTRVEIRGFGAFSLRRRIGCMVRNPKTGEIFYSDAASIVYFRQGLNMAQRVNNLDSSSTTPTKKI